MLPWLHLYPDRERVSLLIEGFADGFLLPIFSGTGCSVVNNFKVSGGLQAGCAGESF